MDNVDRDRQSKQLKSRAKQIKIPEKKKAAREEMRSLLIANAAFIAAAAEQQPTSMHSCYAYRKPFVFKRLRLAKGHNAPIIVEKCLKKPRFQITSFKTI